MDVRFVRTSKGDAALGLASGMAPKALYLLKSLDRPLTAEQWMSESAGAKTSDAVSLVADGFVQAIPIGVTASCLEQPLFEALMCMSSDDLYDLLTSEAKLRLGLMRGFSFILALERASSLVARQRLGLWMALDLCIRLDQRGLTALATRVKLWPGGTEHGIRAPAAPKRLSHEGPGAISI